MFDGSLTYGAPSHAIRHCDDTRPGGLFRASPPAHPAALLERRHVGVSGSRQTCLARAFVTARHGGPLATLKRHVTFEANFTQSSCSGCQPVPRCTFPAVLRCDNGPELACNAMADWAEGHVGLPLIVPGEPWGNGYVESFNSRIRDGCLNINSFWSLTQASVVIDDWKHDYNRHRRHSALRYQPPARYAATCAHR